MTEKERIKILSNEKYPQSSKNALILMLLHTLDIIKETGDIAGEFCKAAIEATDQIMKKEAEDL